MEVITLDSAPRAKANIQEDVLQWDHTIYSPGFFDLIATGVPCTEYSQAKTVGTRDLNLADRLVRRTVDIIRYLNPVMCWIENPRYVKLREGGILEGAAVVLDVDYCQFSDWG